jgi:uncharacterized DUF497 family protein
MISKEMAWDEAKNRLLKEGRGVAFEDVVAEMARGGLLDAKRYSSWPIASMLI